MIYIYIYICTHMLLYTCLSGKRTVVGSEDSPPTSTTQRTESLIGFMAPAAFSRC